MRNASTFTVHSVGSGAEALAALEDGLPDVIVMDIVMADMDGIDTLQALRDQGVTCPVVAYTACGEQEPGEFVARGFSAFVAKAEGLQVLISTIRRLLVRGDWRHHPGTVGGPVVQPGMACGCAVLLCAAICCPIL